MSNPSQGPGMPPSRSNSIVNGPPSAGLPPPPQAGGAPPGQGQQSQQNLNQIVLEYLSKKGYSRTEQTLRKESSNHGPDGRPIIRRAEDEPGKKYDRAFDLLRGWIEDNLELYKPELRRLLWPVFVYSYLDLVLENLPKDAERFYEMHKALFHPDHEVDIANLFGISEPTHVAQNTTAQLYNSNRYRLSLTNMSNRTLFEFLEAKADEGGSVIALLLQKHFDLRAVDRIRAGQERSLAAMLAQGGLDDEMPAEDEGIPGHNAGSANTDPNAPAVLPNVKLGKLPLDPDALEDVRAQLEEEDIKHPPQAGQGTLVEELEQRIKQEPTDEAPTRDQVPLPPPLARDVAMEVQKIKENRDRFKIFDKTTGGLGPGISVCMYTFHNTFDSINCIEFSGDYKLVAAGMNESYIRIWSLDGSPLPSALPSSPGEPPKPVASRRLIGHSGPVYAVSFSPSTENPHEASSARTNGAAANGTAPSVSTKAQFLLSASADKSVRLWSLDVWQCLVAYRAHSAPVWDVQWSPYGHYFATCSHDRTARVWATDHIEPLRFFVGHDNDVDHLCWHPNGAYIFTCSGDRTVRMWDVQRGTPVRMFTGHLGNLTALACNTQGTVLASADDQGAICLWDLREGSRTKRMRGHGKGGVWSLSWSVEGTVLVSGGADGTVRVWDCVQRLQDTPTNPLTGAKAPDSATIKDGSAVAAAGPSGGVGSVGGVGGAVKKAKKEKDGVVTGDQIGAFPTKKSPVLKVMFTRQNLVLAAGAYMPEPERG